MTEEPLFCTVLSTQADWRAAVAEVTAEASYQLRSRPSQCWDFGVAYVSGHQDVSVTDIAMTLDRNLGTSGAFIGAAVNGCGGPGTDHHRRAHSGKQKPVIQLIVVQQPLRKKHLGDSTTEFPGAKPFFVGQKELQEISGLVCQIQGRTRVIGAQEPALPRAWREYLGVSEGDETARPKGILLFIDPLASKYVVGTVLSALDLALPNAVKCGAVCADLLPSRRRVAVAGYEMRRGISSADDVPCGVAGLLLPRDVSIHSMVCSGSSRVGPELRVTSADGQVIKMMQSEDEKEAHPATEMLEAVCRQASPVQQLLIEKGGYLLGLEAPQPLDPDKSKVYDDVWGSSERAPSYSSLRRQAASCDWLVRSLEPLPSGSVVIRRENLKRIPPRVGPAWVRCQVHVFDERQGRQELQLMLQRYMGARMTLPMPAGKPFGAMIFTCRSWFAQAEDEVGVAEISAAFDPPPTVVSVNVCGEVAHPGIALGGVDQKRTTIQASLSKGGF